MKSAGQEHAAAKRIKADATIHLTLEELKTGDLTLRLPVAPGQPEGHTDGGPIQAQAGGEGGQGRHPAGRGPSQPILEAGKGRGRCALGSKAKAAGTHQGRKLAQQTGDPSSRRVLGSGRSTA